jgi:Fe-S cluster assembly protein SufD
MTAAEGITAAFNRDSFEAHNTSGAAWLREWRRAAWDEYEATPLPTTQLEDWRYTDPAKLHWHDVALASVADHSTVPSSAAAWLKRPDGTGRVLHVGSHIVGIELTDELKARGVILADLARAAHDYNGLVRQQLGRALTRDAGKFAALNGAFWSAGVYLYVPRGVRVEQPIRVLRHVGEGGVAYFPRTLIVLEEGSHVSVVEEFESPDLPAPAFSCAATEVIAGPAASIQYVALQRWGRNVHHLATQRTLAGRDADVDTLVVNLGGSVARVDLAASLEGPGARSDMLALYFGRDDQHFDHNTRQEHRVPHASSDLLYKGALTDRSRAVFRGLIKVYPKAQRTDAYQTNRNLILSPRAEAVSLPNLEIEADDVRCSHAATVGQLDAEELFYIMSRGISRADAERLVVFGFLGEVLDRLPLPVLVDELRSAIEELIAR